MPLGIGEESTKPFGTAGPAYRRRRKSVVLVDPMTKEIISTVPKLSETGVPVLVRAKPVFQVNDHWFVLKMKFTWQGMQSDEDIDAAPVGSSGSSPNRGR